MCLDIEITNKILADGISIMIKWYYSDQKEFIPGMPEWLNILHTIMKREPCGI